MTNEKDPTPPKTYPADKARQGEIILRHRWSRLIFFGTLVLAVIVAVLWRFLE
jgi:hypothetical protein